MSAKQSWTKFKEEIESIERNTERIVLYLTGVITGVIMWLLNIAFEAYVKGLCGV